jgi:hypothetical protein
VPLSSAVRPTTVSPFQRIRERLRCCYGTMREVDECARQDTPGLWRVWDSGEKPQFRRRPNVNAQPRRAKKRAALVGSVVVVSEVEERSIPLYLQALGR